MADWSGLSSDPLLEIALRLTCYEDLLAFRSVCTSWRSAAALVSKKLIHKLNQIPCLMLAPQANSKSRNFFSLSDGAVHQLVLPDIARYKCLSSRGWILSNSWKGETRLIHPVTGIQYKLPHLRTLLDWKEYDEYRGYSHFIGKFVLSLSPSADSGFTVMIIYGMKLKRLACCQAGDEAWTEIDPEWDDTCYDIIHYNDKFYAFTAASRVLVIDVKSSDYPNDIIRIDVAEFPYGPVSDVIYRKYLVELAGNLLLVLRENDSGCTYKFQVYRVDLETNAWTQIYDLGNRALFLGYNSSYSVDIAATKFRCKANCIYFTDDRWNVMWSSKGRDMGVYNLQDGVIEPHFEGTSISNRSPPIWVEQNF